MTSYPVGNKTWLTRKPCYSDKNYWGTLSGSHSRSFRIRHVISPGAPQGGEIMMTSYPVGNKTSLSWKPSISDKNITKENYQKVMIALSALSEFVLLNRVKRPLAVKSWWRHIRFAIKPRYFGNHASQIKSYNGLLSGSLFQNPS